MTLAQTLLRVAQHLGAVAPLIVGVSSIGALGCTSILGDYQLIDKPAPANNDASALNDASGSTDTSVSSDAGIDDSATVPDVATEAGCTAGDSRCCTAGTISCQGNVPTTCGADGHPLPASEPCPGVCVPGKGCQACQLGLKKCDGQAIRNCVVAGDGGVDAGGNNADAGVLYGTWSEAVACTFVCTPQGNTASCTGDCKPGVDTNRCNGSRQVQTCVNGKWTDVQPLCEHVCSGQGECTGTCEPATKQCNSGTVQTCSPTGMWVDAPSKCPRVCSGGACTGTCTPGDTTCIGNALKTCQMNGEYGDLLPCAALCQTVGGKDTCAGECLPGALRCSATGIEQCNSSAAWARFSDCLDGKVCYANQCVVCTPNAKRCNASNNAEVCNATGAGWVASTCAYGCVAATGNCAPAPG